MCIHVHKEERQRERERTERGDTGDKIGEDILREVGKNHSGVHGTGRQEQRLLWRRKEANEPQVEREQKSGKGINENKAWRLWPSPFL